MTTLERSLPTLLPALAGVLLHGLRLLPVALVCPFLGGPLVPPAVRGAIALGLGACAWAVHDAPPSGALPIAAVRELSMGVALALVASMPFEAARAGGRLADTLRGATLSELHVAPIRQRESATGDLLVQWTVVLAATAGGDRLVIAALLDTFRAVPAGSAEVPGALLTLGLRSATEILACGLAIGAPAAAGVLAAEIAISLAARVAPQLLVTSTAQPARAAIGLAALCVAASALAARLASTVALSSGLVRTMAGPP